MSKRIDERIVEMSFENSKFEKGIEQSKGSLKEFSKALEKGVGKDPFGGLEKDIGSVSKSFTAFEQIAIGGLRRIGEVAVDAGASLIKSLTIDQLVDGLSKYEQKINSVQTMVSAGYDFSTVEASMQQLMWFSDETSYSFADMSDNMAKFVAAGVDLDTSSKAMKGIATWAAHSGKNSQAASIAMFNMSQAISMGYVDTLNWRSIMNQNMNTTMFKQIAIDVAEATGAIQKGQVTIQNFDSNLKDKWFTNDVLLKTLEQYSNYADKVYEVQQKLGLDTAAQAMDYMAEHAEEYGDVLSQIGNAAFHAAQESKSFSDSINATMDAVSTGWMRTYEIIFGQLDEAKANFSALTEILWTVFASGAEHRNEMLQWLKDAGGISNVFQGFKNIATALLKVLQPISKAFDQIFPPKTEAQWLNITKIFADATQKLIITDAVADKLQRTFAGFFAVVDIGWQVVKFLGSALLEVVKIFIPAGDGVLSLTANLGDFLVMLNQLIKQSGVFQYALLGVKIAVVLIRNAITAVVKGISNFVTELWYADDPIQFITDKFKRFGEIVVESIKVIVDWVKGKFSGAIEFLSTVFDTLFNQSGVLKTIGDLFKSIGTALAQVLSPGVNSLGEALKNLDFSKIMNFVVGGFLLYLVLQVAKAVGAFGNLANSASGLLDTFAKRAKQNTTIKDLAISIALLAASIKLLSTVPADELKKSLIGLGAGVLGLVAAFAAVKAIEMIPSKGGGLGSTAMIIGLGTTLIIMSKALKTIASIDENSVWRAVGVLSVLTVLVTAMSSVMLLLTGLTKANFNAGAIKSLLTGFGIGMLALAGSIAIINTLSNDAISKGVITMTALVGVIGLYQILIGKATKISGGNKFSANILSMAVGLTAMVGVLKLLSLIDHRSLTNAVPNLALMALIIGGFQAIVGLGARIGGGKKLSVNLISMVAALGGMTALVAILGQFEPETLDKGTAALARMGGIIVGVELLASVAARISGSGNKLQKILMSTTISMGAMVGLIAIINAFSPEQISQGLKTLTAMAGIIAGIEILAAVSARISGKDAKVFGTMIGISVVVMSLAASLALLAMIDQTSLSQAAQSLTSVVVAAGLMSVGVAALIQAVQKMSASMSSIGSIAKSLGVGLVSMVAILGATMLFFVALQPVLGMVESLSWDSLAKFSAGVVLMGGLFAALAALGPVLAAVGGAIGPMLLGVLGTLASLILVIGVFTGIAALLQLIPMDVLIDGFDALAVVGEGIGRFIGNFIGGIGGGMLESVGHGLADFFQSMSGITPESVETLKSLAGAFLAITGAAVLDGIANFISGKSSVETFGEELGGLIGAFTDITTSDADHATAVLAAMAPMVENLQIFSDLASGLPNSGLSVVSVFVGDNTIDTFGTQLTGLVNAFTDVTTEAANHATTVLAAMAPMVENLQIFSDLASGLPNSGLSVVSVFVGDNTIDTFGTQLTGLVQAFAAITTEEANHATTVLAAMVPMVEGLTAFSVLGQGLPNSGLSVVSVFVGDNKIDDFADQLGSLITTFASIAPTEVTAAKTTVDTINKMLPALTSFSDLSNGLKNSGGLAQLFTGNTTLNEFADELIKFVATLGKADWSTVSPALKSMEEIKVSFEVVGKEILENAAASFTNNQKLYTDAIATILDAATKKVKGYESEFKTLGKNLVKGLQNGITSEKNSVLSAIGDVATAIVNKAKGIFDSHSPSRVFDSIGRWCTIGLANGITSKKSVAVKAGEDMASATEEGVRDTLGVHSLSKIFFDIGNWIPKSLGEGINNGKNDLLGIAQNLGIDTSFMTMVGMVSGLEGGEGQMTSTIASLLEIFQSDPTVTDAATGVGGGIGDHITSTMQAALSDSSSGLGGSKTASTVKSELEKIQAYIEEENFYGRLSLQEELDSYRTTQALYAEGSEERKKIDREIYRLEKEMYEARKTYVEEVTAAQEDAAQKRLDAQKEYADETAKIYEELAEKKEDLETTYNKNVADAQKQAAEKLADAKKTYEKSVQKAQEEADKKRASKEKKYQEDYNKILEDAEKERLKLREDYAKKQKDVNDRLLSDIEAANKAYEDAVKSRADAIYRSYGLFDEVAPDEEYDGETLLQNLRDQGAALSEWEQLLDELAGRGVGDALIKELQEMGPSSKAQIKALISLTDEQLDEYVTLFAGKYNFARVKAEQELVGLKDDTTRLIHDLTAQAAVDLQGLEDEFRLAMDNVDRQMYEDLDEIARVFKEDMAEINNDLRKSLDESRAIFEEKTNEINSDLAEKMNDLNTKFEEEMTKLNEEASKKLEEVAKKFVDTSAKINTEVEKKLGDLKEKFSDTMEDIHDLTTEELHALNKEYADKIANLNTTVETKLNEVEKTFDASGEQIVRDTQQNMDALGRTTEGELNEINEQFRDSGRHAVQGFADGIYLNTYISNAAARYMAMEAIAATQKALDEHSPSKIFKTLGQFIPQGLALGIKKDTGKAVSASELMAEETVDVMENAIRLIEESPDYIPTIRPVVDLSDVKRGTDGISAMLGSSGVALASTSKRISKELSGQNGNKSGESGGIVNQFSLNGLVVRSEADIDAIAEKLYRKQQSALRGRGQRPAYPH